MIPPLRNNVLIGHQREFARLVDVYKNGGIERPWLLFGPTGVGKATLTYRFAKFLLHMPYHVDGEWQDDIITRKVESLSHPDLMVVDSEYIAGEKRKRPHIGVDEIRNIIKFLRLTPIESTYKIVVIDGADKMNASASNALLKLLEEPVGNVVVFLISDLLSGMSATIRSRCMRLRLDKLSFEDFLQALKLNTGDVSDIDGKKLYDITFGNLKLSVMMLEQNGLGLLEELEHVLSSRSVNRLLKFVESFNIENENWQIFKYLLLHAVSKNLRSAPRWGQGTIDGVVSVDNVNRMLYEIDTMYLDKQQALIANLVANDRIPCW
ncbi:AAA family ATPase [Rickettsiales endosymbiont of Peranema trichophorum]|uniref:AAA family ATPase n=1 Tax=Rickettsiales endosymbiont of Peranema trichophorum TaxID=2486577 RepID=UPI001022C49D|nr:AAA family ATPase [Rickettsiales endosymbiont of Peranema trichophorum]RZI47801.1 AAA family ATPase [Rickettsiales endosymbiont of Peranema trichophorum]